MKGLPEERAVRLAQYIIEKDATVRQAAKGFAISKSTVHKDVTQRLKQISPKLYEKGAGEKQTGAAHPRRACDQGKV